MSEQNFEERAKKPSGRSRAYVDGLEQHIDELKSDLRSHKATIEGLQAERDALAAQIEGDAVVCDSYRDERGSGGFGSSGR